MSQYITQTSFKSRCGIIKMTKVKRRKRNTNEKTNWIEEKKNQLKLMDENEWEIVVTITVNNIVVKTGSETKCLRTVLGAS